MHQRTICQHAVHLADSTVCCPVLLPQGLGQHSKAVAGLRAAADIMPGDAEVRQGFLQGTTVAAHVKISLKGTCAAVATSPSTLWAQWRVPVDTSS